MGLVIPSTGTNAKLLVGDSIETQNGFLIAPAINYIKNALFTSNTTTGWATYADAAGTTPVDGTGGSPNVTFTAVSGATVRGTYAGRLTKDASNRQGQGASYDFTIDAADTGRPVSIAFDFLASSAYVANDVGVYIYDVTNSTLITPAAINVAAGKGTFKAFFVATTSTSYRLILHVASTNASAWTLDTDNFQVGPQVQLSGAAVTEPVSLSPSTTQGFGTISANNLFYRQIGSYMLITGRFTTGTVDGNEARIGLPSGLTVGAQNGSGIVTVGGKWWRNNASATTRKTGSIIYTSGNSYINFSLDDYTTAASPITPQVGVGFVGSAEVVWIECCIPISQWSSNVTMAERAVEEYASNSNTTDADNSAAFVNGAEGSLVPVTLSQTRIKRVRFQTPIQATDRIVLEVTDPVGNRWMPIAEVATFANGYPLNQFTFTTGGTATNSVGLAWFGVSGSTTDIEVAFGRYFYAALDGSAVQNWGDANTAGRRWRLRKVSGGAVVGFPVGARNVVGDTTGTAVPAGYIGEQVSASLSDVTLTTSTPANAGSISLGVGVWMVFYKGSVDYTSASTFTDARTSISTTSAVQHAPSQVGDGATNTTAARLLGTSVRYLTVSSTQTVYAVIQASFTVGVNVRSSAASSQFYAVRIA